MELLYIKYCSKIGLVSIFMESNYVFRAINANNKKLSHHHQNKKTFKKSKVRSVLCNESHFSLPPHPQRTNSPLSFESGKKQGTATLSVIRPTKCLSRFCCKCLQQQQLGIIPHKRFLFFIAWIWRYTTIKKRESNFFEWLSFWKSVKIVKE